MKTRIRVRVHPTTAATFARLLEITQLPHSRLFRSILLGAPVVPASHLKLWSRLARTRANLTQFEDILRAGVDYPAKAEHLAELELAQADLRSLRQRLLGRDPS